MRVFILSLALLISCLPGAALAWGERGHVLIADLAYARLTLAARAGVDALVAEDFSASPGCPIRSFRDAALWSDCVRQIPSYRNQSSWHYDNIPLCGAADYTTYCANGNCATAAIARAERTLRNSRLPARDRQRALARLVHLIGDIHQPLHAVDNGDRGGNDVSVVSTWDTSRPTRNLHAVWDSALVDFALGPNEGAAANQMAALAAQHSAEWSVGDARAWAAESHQAAVDGAYNALPVPTTCNAPPATRVSLDGDYAERAAPIVRAQLARAAVRLASTLNAAF